MKHAIATQLSEHFAAIPILEEYIVAPVLPDAEHILAEQPAALLAAIDDLLLPHGQRYTAYLEKKARILRERVREARETAKYITGQSRQTRSYLKREREQKKQNEKHRA
ncbi:MAG TPA: hypothetical protein VJV96_02045 [Candidatus Angelobacter sp.]|nr:hypothetical protein [Candidatus Angelobacter sp.]